MKYSDKKSMIVAGIIIVLAVVIAAVVIFLPKKSVAPTTQQAVTSAPSAPNNKLAAVATSTAPVKMAPIPQGSQTYQIMQAADVMPKIVQATVNPVDVHVGDVQTLTVIVSDPDPITSVVATIRTDNGTTTVPLAPVGPAALNDVLPAKYFVNAQNQLALVRPSEYGAGNGSVAQAAQGDEKYSATWTVKDTHVARYATIFTATDVKGNTNFAVINWTDAVCQWTTNNYAGASKTLSSVFGSGGCTFSATLNPIDGVENGNLVVDAPLTIATGTTLVVTPGDNITFSGGYNLTIARGGTIGLNQQMYGTDADGDGYLAGTGWSTSGGTVRSSLSSSTFGFGDCNDNNANVFPGQTAFFAIATTTNMNETTGQYDGGGEVNFDYACDGIITEEYTQTGGTYPSNSCEYNGSPCQTLVVNAWVGSTIPSCGGSTLYAIQQGSVLCINDYACPATVKVAQVQACN